MKTLSALNDEKNHLANWLFIMPDVSSVHERMELEWLVKSGYRPKAICPEIKSHSAQRYFEKVFHIEDCAPSKFLVFYGVGLFLLRNFLTLTFIPPYEWKRALAYVRDEIQIGMSIEACVRKNGIPNVYSFWAFNPIRNQVLKMFHAKVRSVTRAHGGDIYQHSNYIGQSHIWPWRKKALQTYDCILSVSVEGTEYMKSRNGLSNVSTMYLGSRNPQKFQLKDEQKKATIFVSVSNIIPIKRLERIAGIIKALENPVQWHHFGNARSDIFEHNIKSQINSFLVNSPHTVIWHGRKKPEEIFQFYQEKQPQLFLSCSESEGIPVSVMEAMSCGIPIFTTDAGGSHELIKGNGICVPIEFNSKSAASWITNNIFDPNLLKEMRHASLKHWRDRFCFDTNQYEWMRRLMNDR